MEELFENQLNALRMVFEVKNDKQLAEKLEVSYSAIDAWKRRKSIPKKYNKYIQNNQKSDFIRKNDVKLKSELIDLIDELDEKKIEYYFHKIKSDILEDELK
ncbi:MAG: hypothetical protein WA916_06050 [Arcobacter sp.]|uniref:hypothetical protein n=1 Tax=Arcobacter sp. TaxID=1872629 RepID=UPI003C710FC6